MTICYSFPSRSRNLKFFNCLNNIRQMSANKDYFIVAKIDMDDLTMNNKEVLNRIGTEYPEVIIRLGESKNKVDAINRSLDTLPNYDIIIIMSDDIVWDVKGFDNEIRAAFKQYFPNLDGTVHFPDDHGRERTIIVSMLGVNLYKQLGYLYFPDYSSVYADNDFTEMTRLMNKYVFVNKRLFSHVHPIWRTTSWDEQYRRTEHPDNYAKDGAIFHKRRAINFGIK